MSARPDLPLLVVEDSDADYDALRWALRKVGLDRPVRRCATGADLLDYLRHTGPYRERPAEAPAPALILLDLNLSADDGREVLAEINSDAALRRIPVVVWTTSAHPGDVEHCYANGASGYATKPVDVDQLVASLRDVTQYWFGRVILPDISDKGRLSYPAPGAGAHADE